MPDREQHQFIAEVPIELAAVPISPWLRLGTLDVTPPAQAVDYARLRKIDDFTLLMLLEGRGWVWCENLHGSIDLFPGDIVFIPPGFVYGWNYGKESHLGIHFDMHANPSVPAFFTAHGLKSKVHRLPVSTMPVFCLHFAGTDSEDTMHIPLRTTPRNPDLWRQRLETLVYLYQTRREQRLDSQLLIAEILSWTLSTLAHGEDASIRSHNGVRREISQLLRDLKDPRTRAKLENLSIDQLANQVGLAPCTFRHDFRKATGRNPYQYLVERRIEQASGLLVQTDGKIRDIALTVGYDDPYHFSRVFRRVTGLSPAKYRESAASGNLQIKPPHVEEANGIQVVPFGPREQQEYQHFIQHDDSEA